MEMFQQCLSFNLTFVSLIVLLIKYITTVRDGVLKKKVLFVDIATNIVNTYLWQIYEI